MALRHAHRIGLAPRRAVGFAVDEPIEDVISTIASRGVAVQGPVVDAEGRLKLAFFTDPDGN
jgi:hypothetical protein